MSRSAEVSVRSLRRDDLATLNRELPTWSSTEYARRMAAQERGELVQAIAWAGDAPVGRGMVLFPAHEEYSISSLRERCAEVRDVFVPVERRRTGVGRAVMRALEDAAADRGVRRVGLTVSDSEDAVAARALYAGLGYTRAHGPFITSRYLEGDDGPFPVCAVLVYLTKQV